MKIISELKQTFVTLVTGVVTSTNVTLPSLSLIFYGDMENKSDT